MPFWVPARPGQVSLIYSAYPGFQAINWVDPKGVIRWVYPVESNKDIVNKDLHAFPDSGCREAFLSVEQTHRSNITPVMELWQGEEGFAVDIPLVLKDETLQVI